MRTNRSQNKKEHAAKTQAHATAEMVAADNHKAQILQDQAPLALFTILDKNKLSQQAIEYLEAP